MKKSKIKRKNVKSPAVISRACQNYFDYERKLLLLFLFIINLAERADHVAHTAAKVLAEIDDKPVPENKKPTMKHLRDNHLSLLFEILLSREIDNYQKYLSDILFEIFIQKPETLKSKAPVEVKEVLEHSSIEAFIKSYAAKKVDDLAYKSFAALQEFFKERFGILIDDKKGAIALAIEIRNISIHNRCIINKKFISKTNEPASNEGQIKKVDGEMLKSLLKILPKSVGKIDSQARNKCGVKGKRFMPPSKQKPVPDNK